MICLVDDREQRASRRLDAMRERAAVIEPDWWLRLECRQVIDNEPPQPPRRRNHNR